MNESDEMKKQTVANKKLSARERIVVKDYMRDSTIWDALTQRKTDIIIASCYKSGTTLTQQIVNLLVHGHDDFESIHNLSPWVDYSLDARETKIDLIDQLPEPRILKTHLPFEALPYNPEGKYICLFRDGRDVAVSLFNHVHAYTPEAYLKSASNFYKASSNFVDFWDKWLETGKPMWCFWEFINSWWKVRHLPNVLPVHFADLINDKANQIERIAIFLGVTNDLDRKAMILHRSSIEYMRQNSDKFEDRFFEQGRFVYKGTNGRWKDLLSEQKVREYENKLTEKLELECANWVSNGGDLPLLSEE